MQVQPLYLCLLGTNPAAKVFEVLVFIYLFDYVPDALHSITIASGGLAWLET